MADKDFTEKEKLACENYLSNNFNKTKALIDAGYSENSARQQATVVFAKVYIRDYLKKRIDELLDNRTELQKQWIDNVTEMAFYELTGDSETDKYRANDKTKALELLGKYLTLFVEKKEIDLDMKTQVIFTQQDVDLL